MNGQVGRCAGRQTGGRAAGRPGGVQGVLSDNYQTCEQAWAHLAEVQHISGERLLGRLFLGEFG